MKQEKIWKGYEQPKPSTENLTGIPIQMKMDFEHRSGLSFDDVRVNYNSDKPAKVGALAYTQGNQVHIGPGQERYLKHELGHVVQQKIAQIPTSGYRNGYRVNTSHHLEYMADHIPHFVTSASRPAIVSNQPMQLADFSASVSLVLNNEGYLQQKFSPNELLVDTVKLTGRAKTGLTYQRGRTNVETQGDHTIADAAIKKYQKILLRGRPLGDALYFYQTNSQILLRENSFEGWSDHPRAKNAVEMANALIQQIEQETNNSHTITGWRSVISRIIVDYNTAYSHGMLATRGKGTGGKGESSGIEGIRRLKFQNISESLYGISQSRFDKLLDTAPETLEGVFGENTIQVINYLRLKMLVMLSQLTGYHGHSTPEASDEKVFAGDLSGEGVRNEIVSAEKIGSFAPFATEEKYHFLINLNVNDFPDDRLLSDDELLKSLSDMGIEIDLSVVEESMPDILDQLSSKTNAVKETFYDLENMEELTKIIFTMEGTQRKRSSDLLKKYLGDLVKIREALSEDDFSKTFIRCGCMREIDIGYVWHICLPDLIKFISEHWTFEQINEDADIDTLYEEIKSVITFGEFLSEKYGKNVQNS